LLLRHLIQRHRSGAGRARGFKRWLDDTDFQEACGIVSFKELSEAEGRIAAGSVPIDVTEAGACSLEPLQDTYAADACGYHGWCLGEPSEWSDRELPLVRIRPVSEKPYHGIEFAGLGREMKGPTAGQSEPIHRYSTFDQDRHTADVSKRCGGFERRDKLLIRSGHGNVGIRAPPE
jgi:hypothetical protein